MLALLSLALACAALAGDVWSTAKVIGQGGHESNPAMRWLMSKVGMWPALVVTHVGLAVFLAVLNIWWIDLIVAAVFGAVTFHNLGQVRKV